MLTRRTLLQRAAVSAAVLGGVPGTMAGSGAHADASRPLPGFTRTTIAGTPRERGRRYGALYRDGIHAFLDRELHQAFIGRPSPKEEMLRYAAACGDAVRSYSPVIYEELGGMAEGSGLRLEELVLITLHEELYHKGALPKVPHCTAAAAGPPDTTGATYVGQTWDWMTSVAGLSTLLLWKRPEGPSLLAYGFPGLWTGAGLNSAGLALCWTSAALGGAGGARVGIPSYVLLTHLLYQESLAAVAEEARRATHAGWFTFVMADGQGNLLNVEGSPAELAIEEHRGRLARVSYGSRRMTRAAAGDPLPLHPRCRKMLDIMGQASGKIDHRRFQEWFQDPAAGIAAGAGTIDMMVFDTTARTAYLSRGPAYGPRWERFGFADEGRTG